MTPIYQPTIVDQIKAALDLRAPNADALTTVAVRAAEHFAAPELELPFEAVLEMATGVGKTYVMAAAIDYFTALGGRNFAIVTPGRTVTRKTIANFTLGHPKSLLGGMETQPMVVTAENFDSPAVADAFGEDSLVKLYIFTVQALLTPTTKADRRTHEFQESLGAGFYARLRDVDDLIVLADEYHLYGTSASKARKFRDAISGLEPQMLIGLTATAPKGSPIIYRYPLAAAIADGYVKYPVIDGRSDDRSDVATKLTDGLRLLATKVKAVDAYRTEHQDAPEANPVMLVIAKDTEAADEAVAILRRPDFADGAFADAILRIHSNMSETETQDALAELDAVEQPDSKVRVIVSVGMLKEGWDVRNVFVICSLRASVSEILTEQTLGRGLRLPFGKRTGNEVLDTLDLVAHERYDELLKRVEKSRIELIDYRTAPTPGAIGGPPNVEQAEVAVEGIESEKGSAAVATITFADVDERVDHADAVAATLGVELHPREVEPPLVLPIVQAATVEVAFSLNQITDLEPFRQDARRIVAKPEDRLRRKVLGGKKEQDQETGRVVASLVRRESSVDVRSQGLAVPLVESQKQLVERILLSGLVASREKELRRLGEIVRAFIDAMGEQAESVLAAFAPRAADLIVKRIAEAQAEAKPAFHLSDEIVLRRFNAVRFSRPIGHDRGEPFVKGAGFTGFTKSLYSEDWFDSATAEFALATVFEDAQVVAWWLRLQRGDLPLPWSGGNYNPDFVVAELSGDLWVVEGKSDRDIENEDVQSKRSAANQWANHVRTGTGAPWHYMFVSETDIRTAKGSWPALKKLSGAD